MEGIVAVLLVVFYVGISVIEGDRRALMQTTSWFLPTAVRTKGARTASYESI
jgi:hypothetical protein